VIQEFKGSAKTRGLHTKTLEKTVGLGERAVKV